MKQKGLPVRQARPAPIVIVILIATLAIGGYFIYSQQTKPVPELQTLQTTPTPSSTPESSSSTDTANWKTYTNDSFLNFSIKYPSNWIVKEHQNDVSKQIEQVFFDSVGVTESNFNEIYKSNFPGDPNSKRVKGSGLSIAKKDNSENLSVKAFVNQIVGGCRTNNKTNQRVDGIIGVMYSPDTKSSCRGNSYSIYLPKDKYIYIISFASANTSVEVFDQILSTFRFLP